MEGDKLSECLKRRHRGRRNAVKSALLEAGFHISGKELRDTVNALRRAGQPICSDENGYCYAETVQEIIATIRHLNRRIAGIEAARNGLIRACLRLMRGGDGDQ
jgi:hypothetical protein